MQRFHKLQRLAAIQSIIAIHFFPETLQAPKCGLEHIWQVAMSFASTITQASYSQDLNRQFSRSDFNKQDITVQYEFNEVVVIQIVQLSNDTTMLVPFAT